MQTPPRLWQRQPGEAPADFTAFVTYLRLKGRRSHRAVAAQIGRSLGAIRRLSSQFNWRGRVDAFEARLADASQDALDLLVRSTATRTTADYERFRVAEFQLAQRVLRESGRWLRLATDPHRRDVSLGQICQLTELGTKLGRLAAGMPTSYDPPRRPRREDAPGYWTGPSPEEALKKIYGSPAPEPSRSAPVPGHSDVRTPPVSPVADVSPLQSNSGSESGPANVEAAPSPSNSPPATTDELPTAPIRIGRRDAWSTWSRAQRQSASITNR